MLTRDLEYKGISFRKGDLVWVQHMMYGLDDRKYPDPLKIDFDDIYERIHRIRISNTAEHSLVWSPDSKKLVFQSQLEDKKSVPMLPRVISKEHIEAKIPFIRSNGGLLIFKPETNLI